MPIKKTDSGSKAKIAAFSLLAGFLCTFALAGAAAWYSEKVQGGIADAVMRLHVLANSNSDEDQALKLLVRDGVLSSLYPELSKTESVEEAREILTQRLSEIERTAQKIVTGEDFNYTVKAELAHDFFPTRTYNDVSLPAGEYETLRIEIGEAEGNNWWCVMFPPLCFVDLAIGRSEAYFETNSSDGLKGLIPAEGYEIVANTGNVEIKFKIVELWQTIKNFFTGGKL